MRAPLLVSCGAGGWEVGAAGQGVRACRSLTLRPHFSPSLSLPSLCAGEDALVNISVENKADGAIRGHIRIRAKTQGVALSLGDRITAKQK